MNSYFKFLLVLVMFACMPQVNYSQITPPHFTRGVVNRDVHKIFSTQYADGEYSQASRTIEISFKENIDNVEIIIYKDGVVCEYDADQNVQKDDFKNYLLNMYGSGEYTIHIKINDNTDIIRSFKW